MINPIAARRALPGIPVGGFPESVKLTRLWLNRYFKFTVVLVAAVLAMAI